jgi:TetR/AcrR family transcriptional repressor of mexJK operon
LEGKPLPRRGRPGKAEAGRRHELILEVATAAFLSRGYAGTSIDAMAREAHVAKRTLYARWRNKAALFRGVLERLIAGWQQDTEPDADLDPEAALLALARHILAVALAPEALALHRLVVAEAGRFPELASVLRASASSAYGRIIRLLERQAGSTALAPGEAEFAAEQFLRLVVTGPQLRALGLGERMDEAALAAWATRSVRLFLDGWRSRLIPAAPVIDSSGHRGPLGFAGGAGG